MDKLILVKTYSAREKFDKNGSAKFLKHQVEKKSDFLVEGDYSIKKTLKILKKMKLENNVLLFLGAGNVENIAKKLCKKKQ